MTGSRVHRGWRGRRWTPAAPRSLEQTAWWAGSEPWKTPEASFRPGGFSFWTAQQPIRERDTLAAPDVDGRVVEDLAVAVPAAVGGGAAAGRVVPADLAEDLVLAAVAQVQQLQVRVALAVARCEAEAAHSVHLHEGQVELLGGWREEAS